MANHVNGSGWYVDHVEEEAARRCTLCGHWLAYVDEVGWVDTESDAYDFCEADAYGNHEPAR